MNIKITYEWLLQYLDTDADVDELQRYLSMCGPSVERVEKVGSDSVFDIEITSNRVDSASVYGIAREASAILPMFNLRAYLKPLSVDKIKQPQTNGVALTIIDNNKLCNRIMAVVMDIDGVGDSPEFMKRRLEACDIRSLGTIIDITNYVMLEVGHPTHVFDYDLIKTGKLVFRNAKNGEKLITLDDQVRELTSQDVIIEDGTGRIIDLPGIMGAQNSSVTADAKRIIFFIESNDPKTIRKTSMRLTLRSQAATINEKNPDPALVETAFYRGIELFKKYAHATIDSEVYDVYPDPVKPHTLTVPIADIHKIVGIAIDTPIITTILKNLGFIVSVKSGKTLQIIVPTFRIADVFTPQDIAEEVARVYGYYRLPSVVQKTDVVEQPKQIGDRYLFENKLKYLLKHLGWHESYNYSLISKSDLDSFELNIKDHLKLANTISQDIEYLRTSLLPSLIKNIKTNQGRREVLRFFEVANIYRAEKNELPKEERRLGIVTNIDYPDIMLAVEAVLKELNVTAMFTPSNDNHYLSKTLGAVISVNKEIVGYIGQLDEKFQQNSAIKNPVYVAELFVDTLTDRFASMFSTFTPINPYSVIKLDLTIDMKSGMYYEQLVQKIKSKSSLLTDVQFHSLYKRNLTLRLYFSSTSRNITEEEAKQELEKIKNTAF